MNTKSLHTISNDIGEVKLCMTIKNQKKSSNLF